MKDHLIQENVNNNDIISWTSEELQKWWEAGLVPSELFEPSRYMELCEYLKKNKKILYEHYHRSAEHGFYIELPPTTEWGKTSDLHVIDKRTGNVVRTLEQIRNFELCEGVCLTQVAENNLSCYLVNKSLICLFDM